MEGTSAGLDPGRRPPGAQCGCRLGGFPLCWSAQVLSQGHTASSSSTVNACVCPRVWENPHQKGTPRQRGSLPTREPTSEVNANLLQTSGRSFQFPLGQLAVLIPRSVNREPVGQSHVPCRADNWTNRSLLEKRENLALSFT